jgi:hypothetical protein
LLIQLQLLLQQQHLLLLRARLGLPEAAPQQLAHPEAYEGCQGHSAKAEGAGSCCCHVALTWPQPLTCSGVQNPAIDLVVNHNASVCRPPGPAVEEPYVSNKVNIYKVAEHRRSQETA